MIGLAVMTVLVLLAMLVRSVWVLATTSARVDADIAQDTRDTAVMDAADQAITADDGGWWLR